MKYISDKQQNFSNTQYKHKNMIVLRISWQVNIASVKWKWFLFSSEMPKKAKKSKLKQPLTDADHGVLVK